MKKTLLFLFVLVIAGPSMIKAQNQDVDTLFNESSNTLTAVPLIINNPAMKIDERTTNIK